MWGCVQGDQDARDRDPRGGDQESDHCIPKVEAAASDGGENEEGEKRDPVGNWGNLLQKPHRLTLGCCLGNRNER